MYTYDAYILFDKRTNAADAIAKIVKVVSACGIKPMGYERNDLRAEEYDEDWVSFETAEECANVLADCPNLGSIGFELPEIDSYKGDLIFQFYRRRKSLPRTLDLAVASITRAYYLNLSEEERYQIQSLWGLIFDKSAPLLITFGFESEKILSEWEDNIEAWWVGKNLIFLDFVFVSSLLAELLDGRMDTMKYNGMYTAKYRKVKPLKSGGWMLERKSFE